MPQHLFALKEAHLDRAWLTIGSYDGVHLGHQAILQPLVLGARADVVPSVVLTFHPHPAVVLRNRTDAFYLTSPEERAELLWQAGVDIVITQTFDQSVSQTSARDFVLALKEHLGFSRLWVGPDFALGRGREGNVIYLRKLGESLDFKVHVVPAVMKDGVAVSSSHVRQLLSSGDVSGAARFLGRPYRIGGLVIPGDGRGRTIGVPTANLSISASRLLPASGVYACRAVVGTSLYPAATNIGVRPTFDGHSSALQVETHILDFSADLYGQPVSLDFLAWLRGEQRFSSIDALVAQIRADIDSTRQIAASTAQA